MVQVHSYFAWGCFRNFYRVRRTTPSVLRAAAKRFNFKPSCSSPRPRDQSRHGWPNGLYLQRVQRETGSQGERSGLYGEVYSKLFDSLQDHPQNTDELPARRVADRLRLTDALIDFAVAPPKASNWRCRLHPLVCGEGDSRESSWGHGARDKIANIKRTDDVPHRLPEAEHRSRRTCDAT